MATNRSDVVENFVRYYGRQPKDTDAKAGGYTDKATIDWLTQFDPAEVERLLAKDSPVTGRRLWADYQKNPGPPPNQYLDDAKALAEKYGLDEADAALLELLGEEQYKTTNTDISDSEMANILAGAATDGFTQAQRDAEFSVESSFNKIKYDEILQLKNQMADLRNASARFKQQEALSYNEKLRTTKNSLASRGATFSGQTRLQLGNQSAVGANDENQAPIEGTMPQQRRYDWEDANAKMREAARDLGQSAENRFGSRAITDIQDEFGNYASPYENAKEGSWDYNKNAYNPLYLSKKMEDGIPQKGYVLAEGQSNYLDTTSKTNPRFYATWEAEKIAAKERAARLNEASRDNYTKQ